MAHVIHSTLRKISQLESCKNWPPIKANIAKRIESIEIQGDCCWILQSSDENEESQRINPFDRLRGPRSIEISQIYQISATDIC